LLKGIFLYFLVW